MSSELVVEQRFVSQAQAARILGVSEKTVARYIAQGSLPTRPFGGRNLVPLSALSDPAVDLAVGQVEVRVGGENGTTSRYVLPTELGKSVGELVKFMLEGPTEESHITPAVDRPGAR